MSIRFVFGPAGSGKSTYLRQYVVEEAAENPAFTYFYFVPNQFTLSTQKELVAATGQGVTINIEALSFERFARRVFNELMVGLPGILDDTGKSLLLSKIIRTKGDSLSVLSGAEKRAGTIDEIKSFLSELRQYNVSVEDLKAAGEDPSISPAFRKKTEDLAVIYTDFQKTIEGKYITPEEILGILVDCIDRSEMVKNSVFVFDGFTGFTPVQYEVIRKLMTLSPALTFAFTLGEGEEISGEADEEDLFYLTKKSVRKILTLAEETGAEAKDPVRLSPATNPVRFPAGSCLEHLEKYIFRPEKQKYIRQDTAVSAEGGELFENPAAGREQKNGRPGSVDVTELSGPRDELTYAAYLIRRAVQEEGLHYRDIALLCADMTEYSFLVQEIFDAAGIPCFLDQETDISMNPLPEFISAAVSLVRTRFSYEDVIRFLRTGLSGFSREETDLFDSYLFSSGLRGVTNYRKAFTVLPAGFDTDSLQQINEQRARFMAAFTPFYDVVKKKTFSVTEGLTALYSLFQSFGIEDALKDRAASFEEAGDEIRAREYGEIYGLVLEAMDRMAELSGEEPTDIASFGQSLQMALSELSTGVLPKSNDCVVVGDLTRTRLDHIRILFLLGATDAAIPKRVSGGGILSESEREQLLSLTLELAPTARENAFIQKYYIYLALTKPEDALHVFYGRKSADGSPVRPSYLVTELLGLFGPAVFSRKEALPFEADILPDGAGKRLGRALCAYCAGQKGEDSFEEMLLLLNSLSSTAPERRAALLQSAFFRYQPEKISESVLEAATGPFIIGSVSNLETYAACPYQYFLTYRLRLSDPSDAELSSADIGSLYHSVLSAYLNRMIAEGTDIAALSEDESRAVLEQAFAEEVAKMKNTAALERPGELHVLSNVKKTLERTVWALRCQIRRGGYRPAAVEVPLGRAEDFSSEAWEIPGGKHLRLKGSIDRIDTFSNDGRVYVRVIDYKSSPKTVDCTDLYHGLSLQLPSYMGLAVSLVEKEERRKGRQSLVLPGGFLYSHIYDPILSEPLSAEAEEVERERLNQYRLSGTYTDDDGNLRAMDGRIYEEDDEFEGKSPVISLALKKDGTPAAIRGDAPTRVRPEEMQDIIGFVREKEKDFAGAIARGNFPVSPYRSDKRTSCTFCAYKGICGFDSRLSGYELRRLTKKTLSDIVGEKENADEME